MLTKIADVGFGKERTKRQKIIIEKNISASVFKLLEKHICTMNFFYFSKIFHAKIFCFLSNGNFNFVSVTCRLVHTGSGVEL